jgi:membrane associated rhomboid family serine protease
LSVAEDIRKPFKSGNVLFQIILVNVAVFLILNIIRLFLFFSGYSGIAMEIKFAGILQYLAMPMTFDEFIYKPWTIFTYFFSQVEIGHVFFNMLILFFFGTLVQSIIGFSRTFTIYFYGGVVGALLTLLLHSTVPVLQQHAGVLIGASGSVMSIVIAATTLAPDRRVNLLFIGEVKLIYIALFYIVFDLIGLTYIDGVGHICHLGGALTGFVFIYSMQRGKDYSKGINWVFYGIKSIFTGTKRPRMKVVKKPSYGSTTNSKQQTMNSKPEPADVQQRIDAILDKISKAGYESLSKQEKDYLFTHGKDI